MESNRTLSVLYEHEEHSVAVAERPTVTMPQVIIPQVSMTTGSRLSDDTIVAGAVSLLMGLELREQLTDDEKDFLDRLSTSRNTLTFLIRDKRYIHPQDIELFPIEHIEPGVWRGVSAIFSHRYESKSTDYMSHRIQTACIYPGTDNSVILGLFGPEDITVSEKNTAAFSHLVELFRRAGRFVLQMKQILQEKLNTDEPVIIVNRASGRLIHISPSASKILLSTTTELLGAEYSKVNKLLQPLVKDYKLRMENLASGDLNLAVIILTPINKTSGHSAQYTKSHLLGERKHNTAIVETSHAIQTHHQELTFEEIQEIADAIRNTTSSIEDDLNRYHAVTSYPDMKTTHHIDLRLEMEQAIAHVTTDIDSLHYVEIESDVIHSYITASPGKYRQLFETILKTHIRASRGKSKTVVRIAHDDLNGGIIVAITTNLLSPFKAKRFDTKLTLQTDNLAEQLGVHVRRDIVPGGRIIVTMLQIPVREAVTL